MISLEMLSTINKFKNAVIKSEYIKKLAQDLSLEEDALLQELKKVKDDKLYLTQATPKKLNINPTERLLIKLMLEETELVAHIKESLEPADFMDERTSGIVSIMFDLIEQGKSIEPSALMNYFEDDDSLQLICESTLMPEVSGQDKDKIINDCIQRLKSQRLLLKRQHLQEEIKIAENLGDEERLNRLKEEFNYLIKIR
jgi:hypothetical protein